MHLSKEDVLKIAKLARLRLTDAEAEKFARQMSDIVGFAEQLNELDLAGVEETNQVTGLTNRTRADEVKPFPVMAELIATSRQPIADGQPRVPKSI